MDRLFKQCVGIDISKAKFTACLCKYYISDLQNQSDVVEFENNRTGFNQFVKWSRKCMDKEAQLLFVMEATGVYYESLAYHLAKLKLPVSVVLPNKAKHYAQSLCIKTKNDQMDARILSTMGCLQKLQEWSAPAPIYRQLRSLCRFHAEMTKQRTIYLNHLEALNSSESPQPSVVKAYKRMIKNIEKALVENIQETKAMIKGDDVLYAKIQKLETIKGLGFTTIAAVVAETQGFALITSCKQLASYAGFDVVERQSGTSVLSKTKISKKGNSRIRAALYFPAMVASRYNAPLKEDYVRIIAQNPKQKMIGITALQRKLLLLMYTLWKNDDVFREQKIINAE
jgi:transposase